MKNASRPARRHLAAGALAAVALLGATGCSAVSPIATAIQYSPSDGINGQEQDFLSYRNLALVGDGESGPARLIGTVENTSGQDQTYTFQAEGGGSATLKVPAGESRKLEDDANTTVLEREGVWVGENLPVTVSGNGGQTELEVPLLGATQDHYRDLLPEGAPGSDCRVIAHSATAMAGSRWKARSFRE